MSVDSSCLNVTYPKVSGGKTEGSPSPADAKIQHENGGARTRAAFLISFPVKGHIDRYSGPTPNPMLIP